MEALQAEARTWFEANWDPGLPLGEWWDRLTRSGWGYPMLPTRWFGRGLTADQAAMVDGERTRVGAAAAPARLGPKAIAPLLVARGTDDQKERYLLETLTGRAVWCELFSEPGAGSDLAGLATRAERDGDDWVVTGQKVWTSGAPIARWGLLAARTDPDAPKQRGLTCFVITMDQPGVEVRPLRCMTGDAEFNEVFLTEARVPADAVIGERGAGWTVVKDALALERRIMGTAGGGGGLTDNSHRPELERPAGEVAARERGGRQRGGLAAGPGAEELIRTLLASSGRSADPVVRQEVARLFTQLRVARWMGLRARAARGDGPAASTAKLMTSATSSQLAQLVMALEGPAGMLQGADAPMGGIGQRLLLFSPAMSLMTGTDQVQRNVIGERVLGLPPEPSVDRDVPWREIRRSG